MTSPAISVIIPVYNVAQYLSDCLDSVIAQDIQNIEILCIEDASTDHSIDILKQYAKNDARITIVEHDKNMGLAMARNTGLAKSRGEYVFFLDSDDMLFSSNSLSQLYRIANQDATDEVIGATLRWNEETGEREFGYHKAYLKQEVNRTSFEKSPYLAGSVIACNKLLKTTLLKENRLQFTPSLRKFEDTPFSWKIHLLARSISICTQSTYLHRLRSNSYMPSITQVKNKDYLYHAMVANEMLDYLEESPQYANIRHNFDRYFIQWLHQDVSEMNKSYLEEEQKKNILDCYRKVLSRIPKSSTQHFSSCENSLLNLIQEKQIEPAWKTIATAVSYKKRNQEKRLRNKLDAVHASTSWRITAPFRFVTKHIKKHT